MPQQGGSSRKQDTDNNKIEATLRFLVVETSWSFSVCPITTIIPTPLGTVSVVVACVLLGCDCRRRRRW